VLPLLISIVVLGSAPRRWLYLLALIPIAAAAFLTFSKGLLLISIPASLLLLAILQPRMRKAVGILFVVGVLALLPFLGTTRFTDLLNTNSGTTFLRLQLWRSAWQMFLDHPWLGVGPDNFLYAYRSTYALPIAWEELQLSHPHNLFLDLLTRVGLFGFIAGIWLLAATLLHGYRLLGQSAIRNSQFVTRYPYLLGLLVGLTAGLLHGLIDNSIFLVDLAILTALVVSVVERLRREQTPAPSV
jgi:O-antigen ligase